MIYIIIEINRFINTLMIINLIKMFGPWPIKSYIESDINFR